MSEQWWGRLSGPGRWKLSATVAGTLGLPRGRSHAGEDDRTGRAPRALRLLRTHGGESPPCDCPLPEPRRAPAAPRRAGPCPRPGQGPAGGTPLLSPAFPSPVRCPCALQWQVCGRCREASHDCSPRRLHAVRVEGALRRRDHDLLCGPPLRPDRPERRGQVHLHEAADGRAAAAEGRRDAAGQARRAPPGPVRIRRVPRRRHRHHGQRAPVVGARGA